MFAHALHIKWTPIQWLGTQIRKGLRRCGFWLEFDKHIYRGIDIWISDLSPSGAQAALTEAIDLIAKVDPISFSRIPKYLPGGIAASYTNFAAAWYNRPTKRCYIGATSITWPSIDVASCIIHEMTHGRLARFGNDGLELRIRIEKACVGRELAFARKLQDLEISGASDLIDRAQALLRDFPTQSYTRSDLLRRQRREVLEKLRLMKEMDMPRWLRRSVIFWARRKLRAHRKAQTQSSAQ